MDGRQIHKHDVQKITDCIEHPLSSSTTNVAELIKKKKKTTKHLFVGHRVQPRLKKRFSGLLVQELCNAWNQRWYYTGRQPRERSMIFLN